MNAPILKRIHFAIETQQRQICRESAAAYIDTNFALNFLNLGNPYKNKNQHSRNIKTNNSSRSYLYSNCNTKHKRFYRRFSKVCKLNVKAGRNARNVENRSGKFPRYGVGIRSIMFAVWTLIFMFHTRHITHNFNNQDAQGQ